MSISDDGVRCHFSALIGVSSSPICPASRPSPDCGVVASVRAFSYGELVKTARVRSFVVGGVFRFSGHVMDGVGGRVAVSGGWCRLVVVLAFVGSLIPCPLGRGIICGRLVSSSVCGETVGVSLRFSLSRGPSSCHIVIPVVLAPRPACFAVPCAVSLPSAFSPRSLPPPALLSVFSCGFLSPLSPFLRRAGRGVLCLLVSFVAVLFLSSRFPHSLRSSPCLLVPRWIARVALVSVLVVAVVSVRVSSPLVASSPRSSTSVGGAGVGSLFACLPPFSDAVSPIVRAGGRRAVACLPLGWRTVSSAADCGRRGRWRGSLLALGWRRAMWCRRRVVFGLWCRCLYI